MRGAIAVAIGPRIRAAAKRPMPPAVEQTPAAACSAYPKRGIGFPAASWPLAAPRGADSDLLHSKRVRAIAKARKTWRSTTREYALPVARSTASCASV